jgi:hypothetical protein
MGSPWAYAPKHNPLRLAATVEGGIYPARGFSPALRGIDRLAGGTEAE